MDELKRWYNKTFIDALDEAAEKFGDKKFIFFNDESLSFRELNDKANRLACALLEIGVRKGDNISIWLPNSLEWVVCKFGIIKAGGVVVPVNTRYKTKEAEYILKQSDTKTVFITKKFLKIDYVEMMKEMCPEIAESQPGQLSAQALPDLKNVILVGGNGEAGSFSYEEMIEQECDSCLKDLEKVKRSVSASDLVNIQYTSGTTGQPKGAMLTHRMLLGAFSITKILKLTEEDRLILPLPFFHCFANLNGLLPFIMTGGSVVLMDVFDQKEELRLIEKYRCSVIYGVPTMYSMMLDVDNFDSYDLSSLRTGNLGGSLPPIKLVRDIIYRMGVKELTANYGMTENSCSICATRIGDEPAVIASTIGRPFSLVEAKVVDVDTKKELGVGQSGVVMVKGPYVMDGYYKKEMETKEAIDEGGWLNTGDLARVDKDGNFTLTGRLKDLIMPGGENVSPAEVENVIFEHPKVKAVEVIGVPDSRLGEVVMAIVIPKEKDDVTEEEIRSFCKARIANFKLPTYVEFVDAFPMTPTGKIQKFKLREYFIKKLDLT